MILDFFNLCSHCHQICHSRCHISARFVLFMMSQCCIQRNIQRLTARQLDAYQADAWIMSPPCQPYTRQGKHLLLDFDKFDFDPVFRLNIRRLYIETVSSVKLDWLRDVQEHHVENLARGHEVVCQWLYQSYGRHILSTPRNSTVSLGKKMDFG